MGYQGFDRYANEYDSWFIENSNVLETEVRLVASCLKNAGNVLSIGCGSGLFEKIMADQYGIVVKKGIEPSAAMAEIARKRGMDVIVGTWSHPLLEGCSPLMPYPIELVKAAGFENLEFSQTLVAASCYSHERVEDPCEGYDRGSYVAIIAYK